MHRSTIPCEPSPNPTGEGETRLCGWSACSAHMGRAATRHRRSDCHPSRASRGCRGGHRRLLQLLQARDFPFTFRLGSQTWTPADGSTCAGIPTYTMPTRGLSSGAAGREVGSETMPRASCSFCLNTYYPEQGHYYVGIWFGLYIPGEGWTYSHDWVRQYLATNGLGWENGGSYCNTITPSVTVTFDRGASSELTSRAASLEGTTLMTPTTPHRAQAVVKCMGDPATIHWVLRSRDDSRNLRTRCDSLP